MTSVRFRSAVLAFMFAIGGAGALGLAPHPALAQGASSAVAATGGPRMLVADLVLLRGRLIAGRELYLFVNDRAAALRHLGPALNSRMASIEKHARPRDAKAIQASVDALFEVANRGGGFEPFESAYRKAIAATLGAEASIGAERLAAPGFAIGVFLDVVAHAAEDYDAAVKDGKVVVIKEYEEVYGYNASAVRFLERAMRSSASPPPRSPTLLEDVARIERAVPSPVPLTKITVTPEAFSAIVARLRGAKS